MFLFFIIVSTLIYEFSIIICFLSYDEERLKKMGFNMKHGFINIIPWYWVFMKIKNMIKDGRRDED